MTPGEGAHRGEEIFWNLNNEASNEVGMGGEQAFSHLEDILFLLNGKEGEGAKQGAEHVEGYRGVKSPNGRRSRN